MNERRWHVEELLAGSDNVIANLIAQFGHCELRHEPEAHLKELLSAIIGQQLSEKAARTISARLFERLGAEVSNWPRTILRLGWQSIKASGTSESKAKTILQVAERIENGSLCLGRLSQLSDQ